MVIQNKSFPPNLSQGDANGKKIQEFKNNVENMSNPKTANKMLKYHFYFFLSINQRRKTTVYTLYKTKYQKLTF